MSPGLHLVATPIGNAADITVRALSVLRHAHAVFAEDTRVTRKLLALHGAERQMHSYREHNAEHAEKVVLSLLAEGKAVALVSDAGTPLVSDPGQRLVKAAVREGHRVIPVPGASAVLAALTASGLAGERFLFAGFLPHRGAERRKAIRELAQAQAALVLFEAPGRVCETLRDLADMLGPREAAVARELTKLHEEFARGTLNALAGEFAKREQIKGEIVIVVAPGDGATRAEEDSASLDARLEEALRQHPVKDAAAIVAAAMGLSRREVYARALTLKKATS